MGLATAETEQTGEVTASHECAYESTLRSELGGVAVSRSWQHYLDELHTDGACPPTKGETVPGPTREWSNHVKYLHTMFH